MRNGTAAPDGSFMPATAMMNDSSRGSGHGPAHIPASMLRSLTRGEVVALAGVAATGAWLALTLPVFAQEAYYWAYAQHPDLSYFDHPPMVAWLIWFGTLLFGDGVVGVRLGTWL